MEDNVIKQLSNYLDTISEKDFKDHWKELEELNSKLFNFLAVKTEKHKRKNCSYTLEGTVSEYTDFIKKYPVRLTIEEPYQIGDKYCFRYICIEDFEIE